MNGKELVNALKKKLKVKNENRLSQIIGHTQGAINQWSNNNVDITPKQVANLVAKAISKSRVSDRKELNKSFRNEIMDAMKYELKINGDNKLEEFIGLSSVEVSQWRTRNDFIKSKQIAKLILKAMKKGKEQAHRYSIKPIVEYYPIEHSLSKQRKKIEVLSNSNERHQKIQNLLKETHGIYIFYSSQCKAIYVGKAKKTILWYEIKNAFNRERVQEIWTVSHPKTGESFTPAYKKLRPIRKKNVHLHDIASPTFNRQAHHIVYQRPQLVSGNPDTFSACY